MDLDLIDVLRRLYESEINVSLTSFWDGGWTVKLGDEMNGFVAEASHVRELSVVATWLDENAREHYPDSLYATGGYRYGWGADGDVSAQG